MPATMHYTIQPTDQTSEQMPLRTHVKSIVEGYFKTMNQSNMQPSDVYEMVLAEVEQPLIEATMEFTGHNQSRAANILGLNRGTFRKKLAHYGLL